MRKSGGKKTKADGTVKQGDFLHGKFVEGRIEKPDGTVYYPWNKVNDTFVGKREALTSLKAEGTFKKYVLIDGSLIDKEGNVFRGHFENGELVFGEKKLANGEYQKGTFKNNMLTMGVYIKAQIEKTGIFNEFGRLQYGTEEYGKGSGRVREFYVNGNSHDKHPKYVSNDVYIDYVQNLVNIFEQNEWLKTNVAIVR